MSEPIPKITAPMRGEPLPAAFYLMTMVNIVTKEETVVWPTILGFMAEPDVEFLDCLMRVIPEGHVLRIPDWEKTS